MKNTRHKQRSTINSPLLNDILGLGCIFVGAFTALALLSYSHRDPSWFSVGGKTTKNLAGLVGSHWSALLIQIFGGGAFLTCLVFLLAGIAVFRRIGKNAWLLALGNYALLLAMGSTFLAFLRETFHYRGALLPLGGALGRELKNFLALYLNVGGAALVTLFLLVLAISHSMKVSVREMGIFLWALASRLALKLSTLLVMAATGIWARVNPLGPRAWRGLLALFARKPRPTIDSFYQEAPAVSSTVATAGAATNPARQSAPITSLTPPLIATARKNLIERLLACLCEFGKSQGARLESTLFDDRPSSDSSTAATFDAYAAHAAPVAPIASLAPATNEPEIVTLHRDSATAAGNVASDGKKSASLLDYMSRAAKANERIIRKVAGKTAYSLPSVSLLRVPVRGASGYNRGELIANSHLLEEKIRDFRIQGSISAVKPGPVITIYEFKPGTGVKVNSVAALADDLALALSAQSVRIEAPIPGRDVVGIEVPNASREEVYLKEIVDSKLFRDKRYSIPIAIGKDTMGEPVVHDLKKMPHMLVAGATGSGKSVFINSLICSLLYRFTPHELKLILVDPKQLELAFYDSIPHLLLPVVTEAKKASLALRWAVSEMERRYQTIARSGMRDVDGYNQRLAELGEKAMAERLGLREDEQAESMPKIVIVIDELADLMMTARSDVENNICRLAQKARAAGIHLVLATQRPSVDVITGLIKANLPARLSFRLSSKNDSRTIFDSMGAERLVGNGDMLFMPPGESRLVRMHGAYISENEIEAIADHWREQGAPEYREEILVDPDEESEGEGADFGDEAGDSLFNDAVDVAVTTGFVSASMLQRRFRIGYNRAARMVELMEAKGIVGPADGAKPRPVLIQR